MGRSSPVDSSAQPAARQASSIISDPAAYDAWYRAGRGRWIGDTEFRLLRQLLRARPGESLLDVGCGTGYFSRRFAGEGLAVTALDPDLAALRYAAGQGGAVTYLAATATALPFPDQALDHCIAVTSLCFMGDPLSALEEMLRVTRRGVVLGLLNRRSLLYRLKSDRGSYQGARWDSRETLRVWLAGIRPSPRAVWRTAVFLPDGGRLARLAERVLSNHLSWGGFLAVKLTRA